MKKLNGFRPSHRNKWLFVKHGILSVQELAYLEFCVDMMDFDYRHEKYGYFEADYEAFTAIFSNSINTIRNWHNKLVKIGFLIKTNKRNIYKLACHERYVGPGKWRGKSVEFEAKEKDQDLTVILQSFDINPQSVGFKIQSFVKPIIVKPIMKAQTVSIAIGSSKVESNVNDEEDNDEDNGYYSLLTKEDKVWIKANVYEDSSVPS